MKTVYSIFVFLLFVPLSIAAQIATPNSPSNGDGMALAPARFELEMRPGTETTVVVNLDYRSPRGTAQPTRIVASLNDWDITQDGQVKFYRANSRPNSASSWVIYSPAEATVSPGIMHSIRVTVFVPLDAAPGDHLTALIIEQRPDTIRFSQNAREMIVRYRLASVFYIKVSQLTKRGSFENLLAEYTEKGVVVTPTLKNDGNSVIRPTASVKIVDANGKIVANMPDIAPLPLLAGSVTSQSLLIENPLQPGTYTVKFRIDFQDGGKATEGVTELVVRDAVPATNVTRIASAGKTVPKPKN